MMNLKQNSWRKEQHRKLDIRSMNHYIQSSTIRDKIIPPAVTWFAGEACQLVNLEDVDEEDDEDEEDGDEDEDEEEDVEEEGEKPRMPYQPAPKKGDIVQRCGPTGEQPPECKQQPPECKQQ